MSDDYLSLTKDYVRVFPGGRNEAPAIFKKDNKYYLFSSGLTGWKPNPGKLAVADSIMGEWAFLGNPCIDSNEQKASTLEAQSTYVIPVIGKENAFIFVGDRWRPKNPIDARYIWLLIQFENEVPYLERKDSWDLTTFDN